MALTGAELTDEVQAVVGRTEDTVLIDTTRVTRWLNEGQQDIVEECPGLLSREIDDVTSFYCVSDQLNYSFGSFCSGYKVCHPLAIYYINGSESEKLLFLHLDDFDSEYPDPTSSDFSPDKPSVWTRRADAVEVYPRPGSDYAGAAGDLTGVLRFTYTAYAEDFTTDDTDSSDISRADEGLIAYAASKAWGAIGQEALSLIWKQKYNAWLIGYKDKNDALHAWDGNIYG